MCYGENGTVKFVETVADNVFRHDANLRKIKRPPKMSQ
jgi:transcriptional/translational regulatory protein YebC/TACO1